jgi:hypothetical protein
MLRNKFDFTVVFLSKIYVEATQGNKTYQGWVSGDTETQISVSDSDWKRLGQFSKSKVRLLKRSTGLIVLAIKTAFQFSSTV